MAFSQISKVLRKIQHCEITSKLNILLSLSEITANVPSDWCACVGAPGEATREKQDPKGPREQLFLLVLHKSRNTYGPCAD